MRKTEKCQIVPEASASEKKGSAFKTISFLISSSENNPVTSFSDPLNKDTRHCAQVHNSQEDWYPMGGFERDVRKNLIFLYNKDTFLQGMGTDDVTFMTNPYPSEGEMVLELSAPAGNECRDIPPEKNNIVAYPGRSVLYSRQFHPLTRMISTEQRNHPSDEPWINPQSKSLFWSVCLLSALQ